jgi:YcxB-like protein
MKRHYQSALQVRRDVVGGLLAIAGGSYMLLSFDAGWFAWLLLGAGVVLLAMVGYALFVLPNMIYQSQPKLKDQYSLTFSDDGIAFKTINIDATLQWSFYHSWLFDDDFYIMYHGRRDLSVIPRRSLTDGDDLHLRELLTKNVGPSKN